MRRTISLMLVACGLLAAQQEKKEEPKVFRTFELKYIDAQRVRSILQPAFPFNMSGEPGSKILVVSGPREVVMAIEEALKKL